MLATIFSTALIAALREKLDKALRFAARHSAIDQSGIGFIALAGVAVLNGLVIISFIQKLRADGKSIIEAVEEGVVCPHKVVQFQS